MRETRLPSAATRAVNIGKQPIPRIKSIRTALSPRLYEIHANSIAKTKGSIATTSSRIGPRERNQPPPSCGENCDPANITTHTAAMAGAKRSHRAHPANRGKQNAAIPMPFQQSCRLKCQCSPNAPERHSGQHHRNISPIAANTPTGNATSTIFATLFSIPQPSFSFCSTQPFYRYTDPG